MSHRFPHSRASLTGPELFLIEAVELILFTQEQQMKVLSDVLASITTVSTDVDALIASGGNGGGGGGNPPVDQQPAVDALAVLDAKVKAATFPGGTGGSGAVVGINLSPPLTMAVGGTAQITASPVDAAGHAVSGQTVVFVSSDPTIATVDASGFVTAIRSGQATVTASVGNVSSNVGVTIA